jgi:hypothetical protein
MQRCALIFASALAVLPARLSELLAVQGLEFWSKRERHQEAVWEGSDRSPTLMSPRPSNVAGDNKYGLDNGACRSGEGVGDRAQVDNQLGICGSRNRIHARASR